MRREARLLHVAAILLWSSSALAEKPRFGDTVSLSMGGMLHHGKATISSTREDAPVDRLDLSDLGLEDNTEVFWTDLTWQLAERWQLGLSFSSFDADGYKEATTNGNLGDLDWEIGASLTSAFDMRLYIADLTWDFLKTDNAHLGVGVGVHAAGLDLDVLAEVWTGAGGTGERIEVGREKASVLAPLPNVSLVGGWQITDRLYLGGLLGYFSLSYDRYDGRLFSARALLEWRPWKRFGLGAAYQFVDVDLEVEKSRSRDSYDLEFDGSVLFVSMGF